MTLTIKSTVCFILILLSSMKIKVVFIGFFQIFLHNCKFEFWTIVSLISFTCSMSSTRSMNPRPAMFLLLIAFRKFIDFITKTLYLRITY